MPGPGQQKLLDAQKASQKKKKAPAKKAAAKK